MGTNQDHLDAPRVVDVDLIHQLGTTLTTDSERDRAAALAAYQEWREQIARMGAPAGGVLHSMHDVLPATLEATEGWSPSNRDRALGHAVELAIAGQLERTSIVDEAASMLAFLEGATTVPAPPVPFTAATLSDRMDELDALGLYVWGSDCIGECGGNTTPDSLVCDVCAGTRTTPLFGLSENR